jgi:hypothetical protein
MQPQGVLPRQHGENSLKRPWGNDAPSGCFDSPSLAPLTRDSLNMTGGGISLHRRLCARKDHCFMHSAALRARLRQIGENPFSCLPGTCPSARVARLGNVPGLFSSVPQSGTGSSAANCFTGAPGLRVQTNPLSDTKCLEERGEGDGDSSIGLEIWRRQIAGIRKLLLKTIDSALWIHPEVGWFRAWRFDGVLCKKRGSTRSRWVANETERVQLTRGCPDDAAGHRGIIALDVIANSKGPALALRFQSTISG